jgi:hypothetical protein
LCLKIGDRRKIGRETRCHEVGSFTIKERRTEVHTDNPVVKDHLITLDSYPHLTEDQSLSDAVEIIKPCS